MITQNCTPNSNELKLLQLLESVLDWKDLRVRRKSYNSNDEFDLTIEGIVTNEIADKGVFQNTYTDQKETILAKNVVYTSVKYLEKEVAFKSDLIHLAVGNLVPWYTEEISKLTEFPEDAKNNKKFAILNSTPQQIVEIFNRYVIPMINPSICRNAVVFSPKQLKDIADKMMKKIKKSNRSSKMMDYFISINAHGEVALTVQYTCAASTVHSKYSHELDNWVSSVSKYL